MDLSRRPFVISTDERQVVADAVIIATGAVARRLEFPGSEEGTGYWMKGISACAVCDGAAPMFRNVPIAVIGGGDSGQCDRVRPWVDRRKGRGARKQCKTVLRRGLSKRLPPNG